MSFTAVAERFVSANYPRATIAVLAGSTARGERTASSDIDLLLIGDDLFGDDRIGEAATYSFEGEVFEVFAYTPQGFDEWATRDMERHRPVIVEMLVRGIPVRRDHGLDAMRTFWADRLAEGPNLSDAESRLRRYIITDLLDDLRDIADGLEKQVVAGLLFERTAELMLLTAGRWIGTGKWLPRRLREWDATRAGALAAALTSGDHAAFADQVQAELDRAGGRVQAGFRR
ncbi:nucleotidyltransferase domain-containing protein [Microbacterium esteraromaticum]|uniref:Nucleotidyltransferase domain-containing protein n=1 Tax=Microbacterium esteraromaticum TaxID=57043 RepID=A0A7D8AHP9_9MICO|nr:nucleotidyltransferase domain-containing protein [Microbacterium esteraromaticum]QMU97903.1 nucleotidyltransferase domain-containing protein [Microbacterium esteraromaticum]